jgi:hypothetical protein
MQFANLRHGSEEGGIGDKYLIDRSDSLLQELGSDVCLATSTSAHNALGSSALSLVVLELEA